MASRRILVTGGTRSGKSAYAEQLLADAAAVTYLAPGPPADPATDPEWAGRIAAHQARRPAHWTTVETDDLPGALRAAKPGQAIMIDSLGSWVTAVAGPAGGLDASRLQAWQQAFDDQVTDLVEAWRSCRRRAVAVTNEVGLGLVSEHRSGRIFTDRLGGLNQQSPAVSDQVMLMVAGRPLHALAQAHRAHTATPTSMIVNATSIEAPITSPVTPPSRRSQRQTSSSTPQRGHHRGDRPAGVAAADQGLDHPEHDGHRQPGQEGRDPGHRPGHGDPEPLGSSPPGRRGGRSGSARTGRQQMTSAEEDRAGQVAATIRPIDGGLQPDHDHQGDRAHRPGVAALHDLQRSVPVPARAEAVDRVGQPVQVHAPAAQGERADHQQSHDQLGQTGGAGHPADHHGHRRQGRHRQRRR